MFQDARIEVALEREHKGELFVPLWAHDTSGHLGRDEAHKWAHHQEVDLATDDTIVQVIHECKTCAVIQQGKQLKTNQTRQAAPGSHHAQDRRQSPRPALLCPGPSLSPGLGPGLTSLIESPMCTSR